MAKQEVQKTEKDTGLVNYMSAGQEVKLSYSIVRNFLTKGNGKVEDNDLVQFIQICKYNELNPFLNEAYLVKFGDQPAQMIVSKEAYMKRADANIHFEGFRAGIIVLRDGESIDLEGTFKLPTDELVGGWAEVWRKDRKFPIIGRVNLDEYDKKKSIWNEKKSTMIAKVAKVQALREAFPAQLGAMYVYEESSLNLSDSESMNKEAEKNAAVTTINIDNIQEKESTKENKKDKEQAEEPKTAMQEALEEKQEQESKGGMLF